MILHRNLAVLRVADAHVLEEIRAVAPLDEYVLGWLSPTELVLDPARMRALLDVLEAKGLAPLVKRVAQGSLGGGSGEPGSPGGSSSPQSA